MPDTDSFVWADGTRLQNDSFTAWSRSQPDNQGGTEDCAVIGHPCCDFDVTGFQWFDVDCTGRSFQRLSSPSFICQRLSSKANF